MPQHHPIGGLTFILIDFSSNGHTRFHWVRPCSVVNT